MPDCMNNENSYGIELGKNYDLSTLPNEYIAGKKHFKV